MAILEEETFREFGYYPSKLRKYSRKLIIGACDKCSKVRIVPKRDYHSLCKSCAHQGKYPSAETRRRLSESHKGKHPSEETRRRMSESTKGDKHPMFGKHHSEKTRRKISEHHADLSGVKNPMFGKHLSEKTRERMSLSKKGRKLTEEHKKKISESTKGEKAYWYGKHHSEETRKKISEARKQQVFPKTYTNIEVIFMNICKDNNLPFKYTGDGSFWIGKINPDFIECDGKKIAVDIFGDYWHSPLLNRNIKECMTLDYRVKEAKKRRWKVIIFWESDLKRSDAEQFVIKKLKGEGVFPMVSC